MPNTDVVLSTIKAEMARRGLNQSDIAQGLGMSGASVSDKLSGKIRLNLDDLLGIARILDVDTALLVSEEAKAS